MHYLPLHPFIQILLWVAILSACLGFYKWLGTSKEKRRHKKSSKPKINKKSSKKRTALFYPYANKY